MDNHPNSSPLPIHHLIHLTVPNFSYTLVKFHFRRGHITIALGTPYKPLNYLGHNPKNLSLPPLKFPQKPPTPIHGI